MATLRVLQLKPLTSVRLFMTMSVGKTRLTVDFLLRLSLVCGREDGRQPLKGSSISSISS